MKPLYIMLFVLFLFTGWTSRFFALQPNLIGLNPSLETIGCIPNGAVCLYDASREAQLFIYVPETSQLWVYPSDGSSARHYDLTQFKNSLGTGPYFDFVAVSDTELVFIGTQFDNGRYKLTLYNLTTNQIRTPDIDFGDIYLRGCDSLPSTPTQSLYAFPESSHILVCGNSDEYKLIIVNLAMEQIAQIIDIPVNSPNFALLPWHKVLVGFDGNIYLQNPIVFLNQDVRDIFDTINRPQLLDNSVTVLRYSPLNATWTFIQLPISSLTSNTFREPKTGSISELAGIDEQGNLYYWDNSYSQTNDYLPLLTIFDGNGQLISQIPSQALLDAGVGTYLYQSITGEIIFLNENLPSNLVVVDPVVFVSTPTPSLTPTIPTETPIPTKTPTTP